MPVHEFVCRGCEDKLVLTSQISDPTPHHPYCNHCKQRYAKVFGFGFNPIQIEINSPAVGKFGSQRSYKTALDRHSDHHSERVGRAITYEAFDPRDSDQDPRKELK